ncbi:MAG: glucosaminidase domain-containing protein [Flavobacteriales bacterium]|nr:glucosaminidase domain-containing protein [Flavobacteriales bacterium]
MTSCLFAQGNSSPERITREMYVDTYAPAAVQEMLISGVPASITLAQGILESGDGNSTLAKVAQNHFGIKCHGLWEGEKYYHDDDSKGECFRVYPSVFESYRDHSEFLRTRDRYADLFKLKLTDYEGWAHGLKKAGYATNPKYPELLIKIIEEHGLAQYDHMTTPPKSGQRSNKEPLARPTRSPLHNEKAEEAVVSVLSRQMYLRNNIRYVIVEEGDSYEKLERLLDVRTWQIVKYNDLPDDRALNPGDIIYLQPKRNSNRKHDYHIVAQGESLRWISQEYGIKIRKLIGYNGMTVGQEVQPGQKVWLRKRKRSEN